MSLQVFGCPSCEQPFQVGPEHAGQVVQCPNCSQTVEIPASAFAPAPPASDPIVFQCPMCNGQFGVTQEMDGQQVSCPHCQNPVQIQFSPPEPQEPEIKIRTGKKKKSESFNADLFAPGFDQKEKKPRQPIQETREDSRAESIPLQRRTPVPPPPPEQRASGKQTSRDSSAPDTKAKRWKGAKPRPSSKNKKGRDSAKPPTPETEIAQTPAQTTGQPQPEPATTTQPPTTSDQATSPPATSINEPPRTTLSEEKSAPDESKASNEVNEPTTEPQLPSIEHLLPPKFTVIDPEQLAFRNDKDQHKVLLPDGDGGTAQIDNRVLRVEHGGEQVSLVALTPAQKKQKRLIQNIVVLAIATGILVLVFWLLSG